MRNPFEVIEHLNILWEKINLNFSIPNDVARERLRLIDRAIQEVYSYYLDFFPISL